MLIIPLEKVICGLNSIRALDAKNIGKSLVPSVVIIQLKTGALEQKPAQPIRQPKHKGKGCQEILIAIFCGIVQPAEQGGFIHAQLLR